MARLVYSGLPEPRSDNEIWEEHTTNRHAPVVHSTGIWDSLAEFDNRNACCLKIYLVQVNGPENNVKFDVPLLWSSSSPNENWIPPWFKLDSAVIVEVSGSVKIWNLMFSYLVFRHPERKLNSAWSKLGPAGNQVWIRRQRSSPDPVRISSLFGLDWSHSESSGDRSPDSSGVGQFHWLHLARPVLQWAADVPCPLTDVSGLAATTMRFPRRAIHSVNVDLVRSE